MRFLSLTGGKNISAVITGSKKTTNQSSMTGKKTQMEC